MWDDVLWWGLLTLLVILLLWLGAVHFATACYLARWNELLALREQQLSHAIRTSLARQGEATGIPVQPFLSAVHTDLIPILLRYPNQRAKLYPRLEELPFAPSRSETGESLLELVLTELAILHEVTTQDWDGTRVVAGANLAALALMARDALRMRHDADREVKELWEVADRACAYVNRLGSANADLLEEGTPLRDYRGQTQVVIEAIDTPRAEAVIHRVLSLSYVHPETKAPIPALVGLALSDRSRSGPDSSTPALLGRGLRGLTRWAGVRVPPEVPAIPTLPQILVRALLPTVCIGLLVVVVVLGLHK